MSLVDASRYVVVPLSIQQEQDVYLVGNGDRGDFYHFPEQGVRILRMLDAGDDAATIRARLADDGTAQETVDVDDFIKQLSSIGFIHAQGEAGPAGLPPGRDARRVFAVDPRLARAVFSRPVMGIAAAVVLSAAVSAVRDPALRLNVDAFYTETNRTALLLLLMAGTVVQVALHEIGHMLAAARHGVRSRYGIGNRLWMLVAQSDLTGLLALPKAQRYFPMLAGMLVDVVCAAGLTLLLGVLLRHGAGAFAVQLVQALVLEIVIGLAWQFNIFVKTDIYFILCTSFSHPDLDRDARSYVNTVIHRVTGGLFGRRGAAAHTQNLNVLRVFSLIWLVGRVLSLLVLFGVFVPTMVQYSASAIGMLRDPSGSVYAACDTLVYVMITLTMLGTGLSMWIRQR